MTPSAIGIGRAQTGDYYCVSDSKIVGGPHRTQAEAEADKVEIESGPPRQLIPLSIGKPAELALHGLQGHWICFDGEPVLQFQSKSQAKAHLQAIESGGIPMVSYRRESTGIGDVIALSGAAVVLAQRYGKLVLPVRPGYLPSAETIFANYPEITLVTVAEFLANLKPGQTEPRNPFIEPAQDFWRDTHADQYVRIYKSLGVEYRHRWDSSPVASAAAKVEQLPVPDGEYLFLHDDPARRYLIDRAKITSGLPIYEPEFVPGRSILAYRDIIENAVELDFMDSCLFHLAEQLRPSGKLYLHRYPRPYKRLVFDYLTRHHWADVW